MNKYVKQLKRGIVDENPTFVQFLGMCPTLAVTTSAMNALGMGLAATAVLICSNIFISLLRKWIPKEIRIASYIVIISGFVSAIELLMKAYVDSLYESLGLYIPLIVVNCIILARAEAFASKNPVLPSAIDGLAMGLGFTVSLTIIGSVREILGAGTLFGMQVMGASYQPAIIFILPAGAFLTLGMLAALVNKIKQVAADHPRVPLDKIDKDILIPDEAVTAGEASLAMNVPTTQIPEAEAARAAEDQTNESESAAAPVSEETAEQPAAEENVEEPVSPAEPSVREALSPDELTAEPEQEAVSETETAEAEESSVEEASAEESSEETDHENQEEEERTHE